MNQKPSSTKKAIVVILLVSLVALAALFWMIYFNEREITEETKRMVDFLPALNALLNSLSAISLFWGFLAIKKNKIDLHKKLMVTAFTFSSLFLVGYIFYHSLHGETKFLAQGFIRPIYFFILISHILTSMVALPLVLYTFFLGLTSRVDAHKKIAPFCFYLWQYVSITGVLVYLLLKFFNV